MDLSGQIPVPEMTALPYIRPKLEIGIVHWFNPYQPIWLYSYPESRRVAWRCPSWSSPTGTSSISTPTGSPRRRQVHETVATTDNNCDLKASLGDFTLHCQCRSNKKESKNTKLFISPPPQKKKILGAPNAYSISSVRCFLVRNRRIRSVSVLQKTKLLWEINLHGMVVLNIANDHLLGMRFSLRALTPLVPGTVSPLI